MTEPLKPIALRGKTYPLAVSALERKAGSPEPRDFGKHDRNAA